VYIDRNVVERIIVMCNSDETRECRSISAASSTGCRSGDAVGPSFNLPKECFLKYWALPILRCLVLLLRFSFGLHPTTSPRRVTRRSEGAEKPKRQAGCPYVAHKWKAIFKRHDARHIEYEFN